MKYRIRDHLSSFEKRSYIKNDTKEDDAGQVDLLDCSLGVNPFGRSALINKTNLPDFETVSHYPKNEYTELRKKIAAYLQPVADIQYESVWLGGGSDAILDGLSKVFIDSGTKVFGYCPQFTQYISIVRSYGGIYNYVPLKHEENFKFNSEAFLSNMEKSYRVFYIDNPNNPTGQIIPKAELLEIAAYAQKMESCLIVDEAYGDYMALENSAVSLVNQVSNLAVIRSFSKGFGLAGLRVGYLVCGDRLLKSYSNVTNPFPVSNFSCHFAMLALSDTNFINHSIKQIRQNKLALINAIKAWPKIIHLETDESVPIMVLQHLDGNVDLHAMFLRSGVLTVKGDDFIGLKTNAVRLRMPAEVSKLVKAVDPKFRKM